MNKLLKSRLDAVINSEILSFIDQSYSAVNSLISSEPSVEVWACNSHAVTRFVKRIDNEQILVVFQISRKILFGFASKVSERGLLFSQDGRVREAHDTELENYEN
ncbi:MAG: hypothetical protein AB8G18_17315 [Gammaproteobacteria bacterium]